MTTTNFSAGTTIRSTWLNDVDGRVYSVISPKDVAYGAVGDGVTDDTDAFNAALTDLLQLEHGVLEIPPGAYVISDLITANLTSTAQHYMIRGYGPNVSRLLCKADAGIKLTAANNKNSFGFRDFSLVATEEAAYGLEYSQSTSTGPDQRRMAVMQNVYIVPDDRLGSNYFTTPIKINGFYRPLIHNVLVWSGSASTVEIDTTCNLDNCYSPNVDSCYFNAYAVTGFSSVSDREEGFWFGKTVINNAQYGIIFRRDSREPHVNIVDNHFNVSRAALVLDGLKFGSIVNNLFYCATQDDAFDADNQPYEYHDIEILDGDSIDFSRNRFRQANNTKRYHYYLKASGTDSLGAAKTTPYVRNIRTTLSGYNATLGAGYCPIKIATGGVNVARNIVFDLPDEMPSTDNADYSLCVPLWQIANTSLSIYIKQGSTTTIGFNEGAAATGTQYYQWSDTPAVNDSVAYQQTLANNDELAQITYHSNKVVLDTVTAGSETAEWQQFVILNGALVREISSGNGVRFGSTGGGAPGTGAIALAGATQGLAIRYGSTLVGDFFGSGSPEGVVTAAIGSTYRNSTGGAGTSFYVKESGSGNTGWVGK